jgi:hypothetical protein
MMRERTVPAVIIDCVVLHTPHGRYLLPGKSSDLYIICILLRIDVNAEASCEDVKCRPLSVIEMIEISSLYLQGFRDVSSLPEQ